MTNLKVDRHSEDGSLVVDSRLIAQELAVTHEAFYKTIKKYEKQTEQAFGGVRFEIGVPDKPTGNPPLFAYLTEDQANFLMTLSRNTAEVVKCKALLVTKFSEAKKLLAGQGYQQVPHTSVYVKRLEDVRDHIIGDHLWSVFREAAEVLLLVEKDLKIPVQQMQLCDGSIGIRWSDYRKNKPWALSVEKYDHRSQDIRGDRRPNAYQLEELRYFRKWLREEYIPKWLPEYLVNIYGKRATLQVYQEQGMLNELILSLTEEKRYAPKQEEKHQVFLAARQTLQDRNQLGN